MKTLIAAAAVAAIAGSASAVPVTIFDLGTINGVTTITGGIVPNDVYWFSLELNGTESFLDIDTNGSLIDTEIGLYDSLGNLVANDDDNGIGLDSVLTFGTGSGLMLGDSFNLGGDGIADGENGPLPSVGTYYLAFGEFNVDFGATGFDVISTGSDTGGDFIISLRSDSRSAPIIPLPSAAGMGLAGLGLLGLKRRR